MKILFDDTYKQTLFSVFKFETISLLGRLFYSRMPKVSNKPGDKNYLNIGCGYNMYEKWVNADFFHFPLKFWKKSHRIVPDWMLDFRYKLKCNDNIFDGVYTEHTLEHLTPREVFALLKETFRIMKPGAQLRIIVPDIKKYVSFYQGEVVDEQFSKTFDSGIEGLRNVTQNYLHCSVWDIHLMTELLESIGFENIREVQFGEGSNKDIIKDSIDRKWESLYVECQKPV